jgi:SAM-dependent methyltransferase
MNQDLEAVDCPVCGPSRTQVWLEDGKPTRYVRCFGCGTVYASPRAPRSLRYAWLDNTYSLSDDVFVLTETRRPALQLESVMIQRHVASGCMLDVGCSIGAFFTFFPPASWERYGVELSPSAAKYAAEKYQCEVKVGTLREGAYEEGYFNLVSLIDTLYYVDDPAGEFQEMYRILKPGGYLAVELAGQAYMLRRNYGLIPWLIDRRWSRATTDSSYIYWFNPTGLQRMMENCGFKITAWYVVPSPRRANPVTHLAIQSHYRVASFMAKISYRTLTWAPKYLCVAQKDL